jgi:hypothetical protein
VCIRFYGGGGSSLENIAKDCWVFFPCVEGFPRIFLVFLCMVILLVILVYCSTCIVSCIVYGSSNAKQKMK